MNGLCFSGSGLLVMAILHQSHLTSFAIMSGILQDPDGPIGIDEESIAFQDRISRTNGTALPM